MSFSADAKPAMIQSPDYFVWWYTNQEHAARGRGCCPRLHPRKELPLMNLFAGAGKQLRSRRLSLWPLVLLATTSSAIVSCSLFTAKNIQTVLEVGKVVCIIANAESDEPTIKTICEILDVEESAFHKVLGEQREQRRKMAAVRCDAVACLPSDGGTRVQDAGTEAGH